MDRATSPCTCYALPFHCCLPGGAPFRNIVTCSSTPYKPPSRSSWCPNLLEPLSCALFSPIFGSHRHESGWFPYYIIIKVAWLTALSYFLGLHHMLGCAPSLSEPQLHDWRFSFQGRCQVHGCTSSLLRLESRVLQLLNPCQADFTCFAGLHSSAETLAHVYMASNPLRASATCLADLRSFPGRQHAFGCSLPSRFLSDARLVFNAFRNLTHAWLPFNPFRARVTCLAALHPYADQGNIPVASTFVRCTLTLHFCTFKRPPLTGSSVISESFFSFLWSYTHASFPSHSRPSGHHGCFHTLLG